MTDSRQFSVSSRNAGKLSVFAALGLSLLVCVGVFVLIWFLNEPLQEMVEQAELKPPAVASGEAESGSTQLLDESEKGSAQGVIKDSGLSSAAESHVAGEEKPRLRLFGIVTNTAQEPLADIQIRWIPVWKDQLAAYLHDGAILGEEPDLERVRPKDHRLSAALATSLHTVTDLNGNYELHVPQGDGPGVVVVWGSGYAPKMREVRRQTAKTTETAARETSEEPVAVAAKTGEFTAEETPAVAKAPQQPKQPNELEIHFSLTPASSISGEVTDSESGSPAFGMVVAAGLIDPETPQMMNIIKPGAPSASVGTDGTYKLQGLAPGSYRVVARTGDSEYVSVSSRNGQKILLEEGFDVEQVDFQVSRGGQIFGRLTDPDENPVSGAKCSLMPTDFITDSMSGDLDTLVLLGDRSTKTNDEGYFSWQGLPLEKSLRVAVLVDNYAPVASDSVTLSAEKPEAEVNLSLTRGFSISGHVYNSDGVGVADVQVGTAFDLGKIFSGDLLSVQSGTRSVRTDDDGAFTLKALVKGEYELVVGKPGIPQFPFGRSEEKTHRVVIDGTGDVTGVVLTMEDEVGLRIAGTVRDNWGEPVEGATIRVASVTDFTMATAEEATTDGSGHFTTASLKQGPFNVEASKRGYSTETIQSVEANTADLDITINRNGTLAGKVVTIDGQPPGSSGKVDVKRVQEEGALSDIQRLLELQRGQKKGDASVEVDGTFTIDASPGKVQVRAMIPGFAPAWSEPIDLSAGEEVTGIEIVVTVGAVLHGKVTLAGTSGGVEGARVSVKPYDPDASANTFSDLMPQIFGKERDSTVTGEDGLYEIPHLAPGRYSVTASHDEYAPADPRIVTVGQDEVRAVPRLVLTVGAVLTGKVTEERKSKAGIMVQVIGSGVPLKQGMTDAEGVFEFKGLKAGEYVVNFLDMAEMQKGKMNMKSRPVVLETGEERVLDMAFGVGHKVFGTVKGLAPSPMQMVTLRRPGGPAPEELDPLDTTRGMEAAKYQVGVGTVLPEGKYEIIDIEPGTYILEVPRMPENPADIEAYKNMDRAPFYRHEITVKKEDLEHNIEIQ